MLTFMMTKNCPVTNTLKLQVTGLLHINYHDFYNQYNYKLTIVITFDMTNLKHHELTQPHNTIA